MRQETTCNRQWNYLADVYARWIGKRSLYVCFKYNCPSPRALFPSFENKVARLEFRTDRKFHLYAMRHTGQWIEICRGAFLDKCFKELERNPFFMP